MSRHPAIRINQKPAPQFCGAGRSVSKNWLADSKLPKCGVRRRIGKPLDRVSHDATAHRAVASPFLILYESKSLAPSCGARLRHRRTRRLADRRPRRQPLLPSSATGGGRKRCLFEKGGRKLFVHYFLRNDFFDSLKPAPQFCGAGRFFFPIAPAVCRRPYPQAPPCSAARSYCRCPSALRSRFISEVANSGYCSARASEVSGGSDAPSSPFSSPISLPRAR